MLYQLQVTFANLQESACKAYTPRPFTQTYKDYEGNPMNTGLQMDVDEFFTQFFEKLENAFKGTLRCSMRFQSEAHSPRLCYRIHR